MTTRGHYWRFERLLQADRAGELLSRMVDNFLYFIPLIFLNSLEEMQRIELRLGKIARINNEGESAHKAFFAILGTVPG